MPQAAPPAIVQPDDPGRLPRWLGLVGGQLFDAGTTLQAIHRGAHEANPLMQGLVRHPAVFVPVKAGIGVGTALLLDYAAHHGHPTAANVEAGVLTGLSVAVGTHNLVVAIRLGPE